MGFSSKSLSKAATASTAPAITVTKPLPSSFDDGLSVASVSKHVKSRLQNIFGLSASDVGALGKFTVQILVTPTNLLYYRLFDATILSWH